MAELDFLFEAFGNIFGQLDVLLVTVVGAIIGVVFGAIPGLSGAVALALLIPLSYHLEPLTAIAAMYAAQKGSAYGGSITAILMNLPGTSAAACTILDGHPLTLKGQSGKALKVAALSSGFADLLSDLVLIFATYRLAQLVWQIGPIQIAGVLFLALTLIGTVSGKAPLKGVLAALLGLLLGTIGLDPISAGRRLVFGSLYLTDGLPLVPVLVGLFVVSEVMTQLQRAEAGSIRHVECPPPQHPDDDRVTREDLRIIAPTFFTSFPTGMFVGVIPGLGGAIAPWVSYGQAKALSKNPQEFGKGTVKGVAAAEAANNAVSGASLIPLLTLGIPGSTTVAIIMAVFVMNGIRFGPRIFETQGALVYGIYVAGLIAIAVYVAIGFFFSRKIGNLVSSIRVSVMFPVIMALAFIGAYAVGHSLGNMLIIVIFGVVGFLMRKVGLPIPALLIAFILTERFERAVRQSIRLSDEGWGVFLSDPISLSLIILALAFFGLSVYRDIRRRRTVH